MTPTAHWLEYVDWESLILIAPLEITASTAIPSASPGSGLEWDEDAIQRYLVS